MYARTFSQSAEFGFWHRAQLVRVCFPLAIGLPIRTKTHWSASGGSIFIAPVWRPKVRSTYDRSALTSASPCILNTEERTLTRFAESRSDSSFDWSIRIFTCTFSHSYFVPSRGRLRAAWMPSYRPSLMRGWCSWYIRTRFLGAPSSMRA